MAEDLELNAARRGGGVAGARAADALLRSLGAGYVTLRLAVALEQTNSDLGMAPPLSEDVVLRPAAVRALRSSENEGGEVEVLVSAIAVQALAEVRNLDSGEALFEAALGVLVHGRLLRILSVAGHAFGGSVYLYRVLAA